MAEDRVPDSLASNLGPYLSADDVQDRRRDCPEHDPQPSFSTAAECFVKRHP